MGAAVGETVLLGVSVLVGDDMALEVGPGCGVTSLWEGDGALSVWAGAALAQPKARIVNKKMVNPTEVRFMVILLVLIQLMLVDDEYRYEYL